jgi:hypothetical protein
VDLYGRQGDSRDGIPQRNTRVGETASVDNETTGLPSRLLHPIDEGALVV